MVSMLRAEEFGSHMGHGTEYMGYGPCVGIMQAEDLVSYMIHVAALYGPCGSCRNESALTLSEGNDRWLLKRIYADA